MGRERPRPGAARPGHGGSSRLRRPPDKMREQSRQRRTCQSSSSPDRRCPMTSWNACARVSPASCARGCSRPRRPPPGSDAALTRGRPLPGGADPAAGPARDGLGGRPTTPGPSVAGRRRATGRHHPRLSDRLLPAGTGCHTHDLPQSLPGRDAAQDLLRGDHQHGASPRWRWRSASPTCPTSRAPSTARSGSRRGHIAEGCRRHASPPNGSTTSRRLTRPAPVGLSGQWARATSRHLA